MKIIRKATVFCLVLLFSATAFAQGRGVGRGNIDMQQRTNARLNRDINMNRDAKGPGALRREEARERGAVQANANASERAKNRANESSVLDGNSSTEVRIKQHPKKEKKNKERKID